MSYRLECQIGGWGAVQNPIGDGSIPVENDEIVVEDEQLARALEAEYGALDLVGEPEESEESDEAIEAPFDPGEFTVSELEEVMPGDYSDGEREALADVERNGKDRSSAIDALNP